MCPDPNVGNEIVVHLTAIVRYASVGYLVQDR